MEQVKNQKEVTDVYTRMKTLKTRLVSNSQLHLTQEQLLQRLKNSINLMQGKFKSSQSENKEQKLWVRQKSLPFLKKQKRV